MQSAATLHLKDFVAISKALSDPHRVRALLALRKGELCVCQLIDLLGLAPSTISKHMSILKQAGLVDNRKDSRWVYYRLAKYIGRDQGIGKIIALSVSLIEQDEQIVTDDKKMTKITSVSMDILCKRQRSSTD